MTDLRPPELQTLPDYACDFEHFEETDRCGTLLKLHGSLNWMYCPSCQRLELAARTEGGRMPKVVTSLWMENEYTSTRSNCTHCEIPRRPVLITPTYRKDYRNPHIARVWYAAERLLRRAGRVIFVGYSLPDDDLEVVYMLKRGLAHLEPQRMTVVESDHHPPSIADSPVGRRYHAVFGSGIEWINTGFDAWLAKSDAELRLKV